MISYLFKNRNSFYKEIEKVSSNISFAELLVRNAVAEPKVSIGVKQEVAEAFFDMLKKDKELSVKTSLIKLRFKEYDDRGFEFTGYKISYAGSVVAYMAYNEVLGVMYTLTFDTGDKQFFTVSLFKNSYQLKGDLEGHGNIFTGIGANEAGSEIALLQFAKGLSMAYLTDTLTVDASILTSFPLKTANESFHYAVAGKLKQLVALKTTQGTRFVKSDAGVGLESFVAASEGLILDEDQAVGYYNYAVGHLATLVYYKTPKNV